MSRGKEEAGFVPRLAEPSASGWTGGSWLAIAPNGIHGWYVEDDLGRTICDLYYINPYAPAPAAIVSHDPGGYGEVSSNAHLIAAAPALYEALAELVPLNIFTGNPNVPDTTVIPCDVTMGELRRAFAALSLGKGES